MHSQEQKQTHEQKTLWMRLFAGLYFPLQYLVVRLALFGFTLSPSAVEIMDALNIMEIAEVLRELIESIRAVLDVEHVVFIITNLLPYAWRIAVLLAPGALFMYGVCTFIIYLYAQIDILTHSRHDNPDAQVHVRVGQPGSGKSSSAGYDAVRAAAKNWETLRWKYYLMRDQIHGYISAGNVQKVLEWYEVRDSYNFWSTHDCVPCLMANIPLTVRGQNVNQLTYEHANQEAKLPYMTVLYFDEIGSIFRLEMSTKKILTVADFFRLCRHAGDFTIYCTEQEKGNIYNDVRRVVGENRYMLSQRWVNIPWALYLPYKLLRRMLLWIDKSNIHLSRFMQTYYALLRHVGQRRYRYYSTGNELMGGKPEADQNNSRGKVRIITMYLPTWLNYQYNDRTYKNLYLAKDLPLEANIFPSMIIEDTPENMDRYLKSTKPRSWQYAAKPAKLLRVKGKSANKKGDKAVERRIKDKSKDRRRRQAR